MHILDMNVKIKFDIMYYKISQKGLPKSSKIEIMLSQKYPETIITRSSRKKLIRSTFLCTY